MDQSARQDYRSRGSGFLTCLVAGILVLGSCMIPLQQAQHVSPPGSTAETERVFCSIQRTGQICEEGSSAVLNLMGKQRENWLAAVRQYNRKLTMDQQELIGVVPMRNTKIFLTPVQMDHVRAWFAAQKYTGQAATDQRPGLNRVSIGAGERKKTFCP
jgi:hypothetical protein